MKAVKIFSQNFLNFRSDMIENRCMINLSSSCSKNYASVVLNDSEVAFLREEEQTLIYFFIVCC